MNVFDTARGLTSFFHLNFHGGGKALGRQSGTSHGALAAAQNISRHGCTRTALNTVIDFFSMVCLFDKLYYNYILLYLDVIRTLYLYIA